MHNSTNNPLKNEIFVLEKEEGIYYEGKQHHLLGAVSLCI